MARTAPGPAPGSHVAYVPEAHENRSSPTPVVVTLLAPSERERRQLDMDPGNTWINKPDDALPHEAKVERITAWQERMLRRFVVKVEGYSGAGGVPVVDADGLIERGDRMLYAETYLAVMSLLYLTEESAKLFAEPRDSSPQATRPSDGIAASASEADSTKSATADQASGPPSLSMSQPAA